MTRAEIVAAAQANINRLDEIIRIVDQLILGAEYLHITPIATDLVTVRVMLADLATRSKGWHALAVERGFVLGEESAVE